MKRIKNSNKGFTLVELLAVIVIIGILLAVSITAVIHFIDRAKDEQKKNQEKTLAMAAENYIQENRGQLPKSIGETTTIPISVLKTNKYITEDIKNGNNESCMENSYVTVYKESKTKYVYKAHLYCGKEKVPDAETKAKPTIKIDFVDAEGNSISDDASVLEKVAEAKFVIEFGGGKKDDKKIAIDGYSYSILTKVQGESGLREVYSSGTLSANRATDIVVNRDNNLKDYIDISKQTTVAIKATVRNIDGGVNDKVEFIGAEDGQAEVIYHDKKAPTCVSDQTKGAASENDWININSANKERKITVVCKDGSGSGCVRSTFTKTWNGTESHEFDNIKIKDNAGNVANCKVRVNIDVDYPIIGLEAYALNSNGAKTGSNILTGRNSTSISNNANVTINAGEYSTLENGYMNSSKFAGGVMYRATLTDTIGIKNWEWEVNAKDIKNTTAANYQTVSNIQEADSGTCDDTECAITVKFTEDGLRKGVLTVYDKAGNKATYVIYANIDRKAPSAPTIVNSSSGNSSGAWTKSNVTLDLSSNDTLSGIKDYYYTYKSKATEIGADDETQWVKLNGGTGKTSFTTEAWKVERNSTTYIKVCDNAGNCSSKKNTDIKIDRTAPTGLTLKGCQKTTSDNITSCDGKTPITSDKWYNNYATVVASGATDAASGGVYYLLTTTGANENVTDLKQSYRNVNAQGESTISFKACDKLGNCSSASSFKVKLDRQKPTKPTIVNPTNGNWTKQNVSLTITSTDALSGIGYHYYTYKENATEYAKPTAYRAEPLQLFVPLENGSNSNGVKSKTFTTTETTEWNNTMNRKVYIQACDIVGNCSDLAQTTIKIDKTKPQKPTIDNPKANTWTSSNFSLKVHSKDDESGLNNYQYTYANNPSSVGTNSQTSWVIEGYTSANTYTSEFSGSRDQDVYWRTCDNVGNCSDKSAASRIKIDKKGPTCSVSKTNTGTTSGVTVKVTCKDNDDGIGCDNSRGDVGTHTGVKSSKTYTVYDKLGNSGTCKVTISTSSCNCTKKLYPTSYTASWCYSNKNGIAWTGNSDVVNGSCKLLPSGSNTNYGCCYYSSCQTCYK